jgi:hypothetical protein
MARAYAGNDVLDLAPDLRANRASGAEREFRDRHLTARERAGTAPFWSLFAAKEAAGKAFAQAGVAVAPGAFRDLEVDLAALCVTHVPSGARARVALLEADSDKVHCVAVCGQGEAAAPLSLVCVVPSGVDPGDAAREALLDLAAAAAPGPGGRTRFAVGTRGGVPAVLESGVWRDWSVSLSHSGRFAAASLLFS